MKKLLLFLILFISYSSNAQNMDDKIKVIANEIADQIVKSGNKKVAVTTLDYKGCNTEFGQFLAEELTGNLSVSGRPITIVNQKLLESLLTQNKLTAKGLLEAKNDAAKLGQVSGIDALVYGSITTFGEDVRISLSIIKLPTLAVFGYSKSSFPLTSGVKNMLNCIAEEPATLNNGNENSASTGVSNFKFPGPDSDCSTKSTCIVCATNNGSEPIKAGLYVYAIGSYGPLYIHPKQTKCFESVKVRNDHGDAGLSYNIGDKEMKRDDFVIEACQVYKKVITK